MKIRCGFFVTFMRNFACFCGGIWFCSDGMHARFCGCFVSFWLITSYYTSVVYFDNFWKFKCSEFCGNSWFRVLLVFVMSSVPLGRSVNEGF